jgi:hypothetical protein
MSGLAADHEACAALLRRSGSSFALPIRLLPAAKRRGTTALYAFCRRADDIVDGGEGERVDPGRAEVALDAFASDLEGALRGGASDDPVIRALVDTVRRYGIPPDHLRDVLAGAAGPRRDVVVINAAAVLWAAGRAADLPAARSLAERALDSAAARLLDHDQHEQRRPPRGWCLRGTGGPERGDAGQGRRDERRRGETEGTVRLGHGRCTLADHQR